ncbi:hypothetical protein [Micromonospora tarensis]|uniref:Secreted protein n=1 Tax=Micromonospora tarensis TaxID=2806100 RepID=A0ABS1YI20_9ACTN|nr:hypothetical protein [Micromonospora tarensis]MBM0277053.1 hypothetical protein [Micromonospora tarensis]
MGDVLILLTFASCLATILASLWWLGARVRRRGVGGEVMGPFEEIWHPAAHRYRAEIRVQETRMVPLPPQGGRRNGQDGEAAELTSEQVGRHAGPQT